jgi:peptide/nickel transport system ATP-binding protein
MAGNPALLIADEPTTALDVTIHAQALTLMRNLCRERGTAIILITHLGSIVETAHTEMIFAEPLHPYTRLLFSAIPSLDRLAFRDASVSAGDVPTPIELPAGCPFHPRCPDVMEICRAIRPATTAAGPGRQVACHLFAHPGQGDPGTGA